ncbi:hypothetical protein FRC14_007339 [Serendipita sp. 396]|nr:hypothetical protein FRC14_007339 [Serendipita sp. 396]
MNGFDVSKVRAPLTLRHSLRKAFHMKKGTAPDLDWSKPTLPIEILELIVSFVEGHKELLTLAYTCSSLKDAAYKGIYKEVFISSAKQTGFLVILHKSLSNRRIAALVTTLRFHVSHFSLCEKGVSRFNRQRRCICMKWNQKFAAVVMNMPNLRSLDIEQFTSEEVMGEWVSTLASPSITQLQLLRFRCYSMTRDTMANLNKILAEPYMQSLKALYIPSQFFAEGLFSRSKALPNLTTICDDGCSDMPNIYADQQITRVILTSVTSQSLLYIRRSQTNLTYLCTEYSRGSLLKLVVQNLDILTNLRHLGILWFPHDSVAPILSGVGFLSPLSKLSSLELSTPVHLDADPDFTHFQVNLPTLVQIIYNGAMWRFNEGEWKQNRVMLTPWDVVNMELDPV